MASYSIEWKASAVKELRKIPGHLLVGILAQVEFLRDSPRPDGVKKLKGSEHTYRIRVGEYRIIYAIYDKKLLVEIVRVRNRKDAYS